MTTDERLEALEHGLSAAKRRNKYLLIGLLLLAGHLRASGAFQWRSRRSRAFLAQSATPQAQEPGHRGDHR